MTPRQVCIAGATGYLGSRVVAQLCARSMPVTAILKDRSCDADQHRMNSLGATLAFADASRLESYAEAMSGADVAISCLASPNLHVDSTNDFWAIDRDANIRFGLAAISAGARHLVLVATFEGRDSRGQTEFSEAKESAVDAIATACRLAGVVFTVIRPTAYFSDLTNRAFDSVHRHGRYTVLGDGCHRINPVDGDDVASFLADCLDDPEKAGREHQLGGPDTFSFRQIGLLAAEVLGLPGPLKIRSVPLWSLRAVAALTAAAGLASLQCRRSAAILRWMLYSSSHDAVAPACGMRRLVDNFRSKRDALRDGSPRGNRHNIKRS